MNTPNVSVLERARVLLDEAHVAISSFATLLDEQAQLDLDKLSLEAKRLEAELCVLESHLRHTLGRFEG